MHPMWSALRGTAGARKGALRSLDFDRLRSGNLVLPMSTLSNASLHHPHHAALASTFISLVDC